MRRRTDRTKPGPGPILGAAEDVLMLELGNAAKKSMPYELEEVTEILRNTCIRLQLKDHLGKPYTQFSDVLVIAAFSLGSARVFSGFLPGTLSIFLGLWDLICAF